MSFDFNVRNKVSITLASPEEEERGGNEIFSFGDHQQVTTSCLNVNNNYSSKRTVKDRNKSLAVNNNYKSSLDDCDIECDNGLNLYLCKDSCVSHERFTNYFELF